MSVTDRAIDEARKAKSSSKKKARYAGNFLSFQPTKAEKEILRSQPMTWEEIQDILLTWLQNGFVLSWKWETERDVYLCTLRSPADNWEDASYLTARHRDLTRSLMTLCYGLSTKFQNFSDWTLSNTDEDLNW